MCEVPARVQRHAQCPLVAEPVPEILPLLFGQIVDRFDPLGGQLRQFDPVGQDRPKCHQVGVDAGVWLGVGVLGAEELPRMLGGKGFDGVDVLAAGVEPMPDGALGVLVGEPAPHGQQDGRGGVVLRRNQLQGRALVRQLRTGRVGYSGFDRLDHGKSRPVGLRRGRGVVDRGDGGEGVGHRDS